VDLAGQETIRNQVAKRYTDARHADSLVEGALTEALEVTSRGNPVDQTVNFSGPPSRMIQVRGRPLLHENQQIGSVAIVEDQTESVRLDRVRRDFVANLSHELRTPIGAIALLCDTLAEEEDPTVSKRLIDRISSETTRVGEIINDLLELSRVELDGEPRTDKVDPRSVISAAIDEYQPAADARNIEILADFPAQSVQLKGDAGQLVRAVGNLVDNAIKYSEPGSSITVSAVIRSDSVDLSVRDSGMGIPRGEFDRIFERFYRVDKARSRETGGTGLGLSIVRHIAVNHRAEILVESREGEGSVFTLRMPKESTQ
jgi:two-component system sensor histidine kinase SenX3